MIEKNFKKFVFIFGIFINFSLFPTQLHAGGFGAEIFCTMRDGGNDHESSWEAAYGYIKRQKGGFFKTSPKQAAAQIIETVVRERDKFSGCVEYLDRLYPNRVLQRKLKADEKEQTKKAKEKEIRLKKIENLIEENESLSEESFDRYNY